MSFVTVADWNALAFVLNHDSLDVNDYLSFEKGDRIFYRQAPADIAPEGWAFGVHANTMKAGWYPPAFVQRLDLKKRAADRARVVEERRVQQAKAHYAAHPPVSLQDVIDLERVCGLDPITMS